MDRGGALRSFRATAAIKAALGVARAVQLLSAPAVPRSHVVTWCGRSLISPNLLTDAPNDAIGGQHLVAIARQRLRR